MLQPDFQPPLPPPSATGATMSSRRTGRISRAEDHAVWDILFARQVAALGTRVVQPFRDGLDLLRLSHPGVPDLAELNARLSRAPAGGRWRCRGWCPTRSFSRCSPTASSRSAISSAPATSSIISTSPTCFTTFSAMCRCSPTRAWRAMMEQIGQLGVAAIARGEGERDGAHLLAQRRIRAVARGRRDQDLRRRAGVELRRIRQGARRRRRRAARLLGRGRRGDAVTRTTTCNRSTSSTTA